MENDWLTTDSNIQCRREERVKALNAVAARVDGSYEVVVMNLRCNKCDEVWREEEGSL